MPSDCRLPLKVWVTNTGRTKFGRGVRSTTRVGGAKRGREKTEEGVRSSCSGALLNKGADDRLPLKNRPEGGQPGAVSQAFSLQKMNRFC